MSVEDQLAAKDAGFPEAANVASRCLDNITCADSKSECKIHVAATFDEIARWRDFWVENNRNPDADVDFYSLFVSLHPDSLKPYVLVATQNHVPKAMLIGRWERATIPIKVGYRTLMKVGLRQLIFIQDGFFGESTREVARAMSQHIVAQLKSGVADRAWLSNADVNLDIYKVAQCIPGVLFRDYSRKTAERWKTKLPSSIDEFLKRRSKKHRYWLRRIGRVFEEAYPGRVKYKTYCSKEDIQSFCVAAEEVARTTYQRGLGVGFINGPETHQRLELAAQKGWLKAYAVFVGDEPVAFWCGRLYNGVMLLDWTGYKPEYRKFEAGTVLFLKMLEDLCRCGATEVDYGTGTAGYKERFGDYKCDEGFVSIFAPTVKGLTANLLTTLDYAVNTSAKALAKKMGIIDRVKKIWRRRLAGEVKKPSGNDAEAEES